MVIFPTIILIPQRLKISPILSPLFAITISKSAWHLMVMVTVLVSLITTAISSGLIDR